MQTILNNYYNNKEYYDSIVRKVKKNTIGRIPHHSIRILTVICDTFNVESYLEIGTHNGGSMSYVVSSKNPVNCIGVDLFEDTTYSQYYRDGLSFLRTKENIAKNNSSGSSVRLIKGNSFEAKTIESVRGIFVNDGVDLLFIDGDHSYEGISSDFNNYADVVKSGGMVVIDDYNKPHSDIKNFCDNEIDKDKFAFLGVFNNVDLILKKRK